jgi:hypothetical protein
MNTFADRRRGKKVLLLGLAALLVAGTTVGVLVWRYITPQPEPIPTGPLPTPTSSPTPPIAESAEVLLAYAPEKATVTLDGEVIKPRRSTEGDFPILKVTPGEHIFTFSMPGFTDFTRKVFVESGDSTPAFAALEPNSPNTADYYEQNPLEGNTFAWIYGNYMDLDASREYLPIQADGFRIDLENFDSLTDYYLQVTCDLSVTTHDACKKDAKKTIKRTSDPGLGLDPALYTISYKDING